MPKFNLYRKQGLAELLRESGIPLIDFQKPNNHFYIVQHDKTKEYQIVEFNPREHEFKRSWYICLQMSLPAWMRSYDDFTKSKRIRLRVIEWEKYPHDGCYFESYKGSWVILN